MKDTTFTIATEELNGEHVTISVYNRGALAGTLTILTQDHEELVRRLSGATVITQSVGTIEKGATVTGVSIGRLG